MPIRITDFSGIVPKLNPERLADNAAQVAHNCAVTSGAIAPLSVPGTFVRMHTDDGYLVSGVPSRDLLTITKPNAPSVRELSYIAQPQNWLRIFAYDWVSYLDDAGVRLNIAARAQRLSISNVVYDESGLYIVCFLWPRMYVFNYGGPYFLRGPRYQFGFTPSPGEYGGPDLPYVFPPTPSHGDPEFPRLQVPLVDSNSQIYAYFEVSDIYGPNYDEDIFVDSYSYIEWWVPGAFIVFRVNMNYAEPRRQHLYYVQTAVDGFDREGPPSEISARIVKKPGQKLRLNTPKPGGFPKNNLYRSSTGADDFLLVDNINSNTYTDWKVSLQDVEIPPYGNYPGDDAADKEAFLRGSDMHPSQFAVYFKGKTLYLSDIYRPHAIPDEYTVPFQAGIKAAPITGNTILVFTGDKLYGVTGDNPERMAKYFITSNARLLNVLGLCRIGGTIYWPTDDGMAASNGGDPQIITSEYFTREQWLALKPETMKCRTAENSIYIEYPGDSSLSNMRFDLNEKLSAVTTYDALEDGTYRWRSKRFYFDQSTILDYVRVVADGTVTVRVLADREEVAELTVRNDEAIALASFARVNSTRRAPLIHGGRGGGGGGGANGPVRHAREWEFEVEGEAIVRRIEAFERTVVTITDEVILRAEEVPLFRSTWLKFTDTERFAVASLSVQTTQPVWLRLYADGELVHEEQVRGGRAVALPRTLPKANLWLVDVDAPVRVDELYLTRRRTVDAGEGLREINDGPFAPWLARRYKFSDERQLNGLIVHAARPVTMRFYYDGAIEPSESISITGDGEIRLERASYSSVEFDFNGDDAAVREVILFASRVEPVGLDGVSWVNPASRRGRLVKFADRGAFACASIGASEYPATLKLYSEGTLRLTKEVEDGRMFFLPRNLAEASLWEIDVSGGDEINSIMALPWRTEVISGRQMRMANLGTVPPWLFTRFQFAEGATRLISAWVESPSAVTMRLYLDGASSPSKTVRLQPRVETLLSINTDCARVCFDFAGDDSEVKEFAVFGRQVMPADLGGIQEGARGNWRKLFYRFVDRADIACGSLGARSYTGVRISLTADGVQAYNAAVADGHLFKLPRTPRDAALWEVDVQAPSVGVLEGMTLIPRRSVPSGDAIRATNSGGIPPWLFTRYEFTARTAIRSVIVDADQYPVTMRLYLDKSTAITKHMQITSAAETAVNLDRVCGCLEFDFVNDAAVRDVTVFPLIEQGVGGGGIDVVNPETWRNLMFKFPDVGRFACGSIGANDYPLTVTVRGDGSAVDTVAVANGKVFQFDRTLARASQWVVDINAPADVTRILLIPWVRNVFDGPVLRLLRAETGVQPWLFTEWQFPDQALPASMAVEADAYPLTMRLFPDGATEAAETVTIENAREFRLPDLGTARTWSFDFAGDDAAVRQALVFVKRVEPLTGAVSVTGPSWRRNLYKFAELSQFACGMVSVSGFDGDANYTDARIVLRLYGDGALRHTEVIRNGRVFSLPSMTAAMTWEVDLDTAAHVTSLVIFPKVRERVEGGVIHALRQPGSIPSWMYTIYETATPWRMRSAKVKAPQTVPVDINGIRTMARDRGEVAIARTIEASTFEIGFGEYDHVVDEVFLFAEDVVPVDGGIVLRPAQGRAAWRNKLLVFKDTGSWGVARVMASAYPVTVRLYVDDALIAEHEATDDSDFKWIGTNGSALPNAKTWRLDVQTSGDVYELILLPRVFHSMANGHIAIQRDEDPFSWLGHRVSSARPLHFAAARVIADTYPVRVKLYAKDRELVNALAHNDRPFRLPRVPDALLWTLDAIPESAAQIHSVVIATSMEAVR